MLLRFPEGPLRCRGIQTLGSSSRAGEQHRRAPDPGGLASKRLHSIAVCSSPTGAGGPWETMLCALENVLPLTDTCVLNPGPP